MDKLACEVAGLLRKLAVRAINDYGDVVLETAVKEGTKHALKHTLEKVSSDRPSNPAPTASEASLTKAKFKLEQALAYRLDDPRRGEAVREGMDALLDAACQSVGFLRARLFKQLAHRYRDLNDPEGAEVCVLWMHRAYYDWLYQRTTTTVRRARKEAAVVGVGFLAATTALGCLTGGVVLRVLAYPVVKLSGMKAVSELYFEGRTQKLVARTKKTNEKLKKRHKQRWTACTPVFEAL